MAGYVVVLDANVLYGIEVTDFFATMATRRLFRPHWSPTILAEVERNLALRPDLDPAAIARRINYLNRALPGALTEAPAELVDAMPVNAKDRHVLALAVHVGAPTIVTDDVRDFPQALLERTESSRSRPMRSHSRKSIFTVKACSLRSARWLHAARGHRGHPTPSSTRLRATCPPRWRRCGQPLERADSSTGSSTG